MQVCTVGALDDVVQHGAGVVAHSCLYPGFPEKTRQATAGEFAVGQSSRFVSNGAARASSFRRMVGPVVG